MKNLKSTHILRISFVSFLLMFNVLKVHSQNSKRNFSPTIGFLLNHERLGTDLQEFNPGTHLGFNYFPRIAARVHLDLQLSINLAGRGIAGRPNSVLSANPLAGARVYLTEEEREVKVFLNALAGFSIVDRSGSDFGERFSAFGYSVGCFVNKDRLLLGLSAESYNNFILKFGYVL